MYIDHTALSYKTLRSYLLDGNAKPLIIVLDCCFSGHAARETLGASDDVIDGLLAIRGAFVLASADDLALAPSLERHTTFTGAFVKALTDGFTEGPPRITLNALHRHLVGTLTAAGYPRPRAKVTDDAGDFELADNPAYRVPPRRVRVHTSERPSDKPPYKGLAYFDKEDAGRFFGREQSIELLLHRIAEQAGDRGPLIVTGASGAGKSSLLRAGLIPAVEAGRLDVPGSSSWSVHVVKPSDQLPDAAGQTLVVVDQFEELYTGKYDEDERRAYIERLCDLDASVVIGLRADFYAQCAAYPQLARALERPMIVGAMTPEELRLARHRQATSSADAMDVPTDDVPRGGH